jgi:hypothetical protein
MMPKSYELDCMERWVKWLFVATLLAEIVACSWAFLNKDLADTNALRQPDALEHNGFAVLAVTPWELESRAPVLNDKVTSVETEITCSEKQGCFLSPRLSVKVEPSEESGLDLRALYKQCGSRSCRLRLEGQLVYGTDGASLYVWRAIAVP